MLVSVAERRREIGIRLAVGARTRDVRLQFLTEALIVSLAGGSLGILAGFLVTKAMTQLLGWPTDIALEVTIIAFLFTALVGVFFGWYPARRAAGTDPIGALHCD